MKSLTLDKATANLLLPVCDIAKNGDDKISEYTKHIMVSVRENTLTASAFNALELICVIQLEQHFANWDFVIPAKTMASAISLIKKGAEITLNEKEAPYGQNQGKIQIVSGLTDYVVNTLPTDGFCTLPHFEILEGFEMNGHDLTSVINPVEENCANPNDVRDYLRGVLLKIDKGTFTAVASDGHRLGVAEKRIQIDSSVKKEILLSKEMLKNFQSFITKTDELIKVELGDNHLRVSHSIYVMSLPLKSLRYPPYEKMMPKSFSGEVVVDSAELIDCIRRVEVVKESKRPGMLMTLNRDSIILESDSNNQELAKDILEIETEFDGFEIGVNVNYLKTALSNCNSKEVKISFTDSTNPIQIVPMGESDVSNIQLVSPCRL